MTKLAEGRGMTAGPTVEEVEEVDIGLRCIRGRVAVG